MNNLTSYLLSEYGPGVRPICPNQETIHVTVDMAIRQLISLVRIIKEREGVIQIRQNIVPPSFKMFIIEKQVFL